jgi:hypothetical protein
MLADNYPNTLLRASFADVSMGSATDGDKREPALSAIAADSLLPAAGGAGGAMGDPTGGGVSYAPAAERGYVGAGGDVSSGGDGMPTADGSTGAAGGIAAPKADGATVKDAFPGAHCMHLLLAPVHVHSICRPPAALLYSTDASACIPLQGARLASLVLAYLVLVVADAEATGADVSGPAAAGSTLGYVAGAAAGAVAATGAALGGASSYVASKVGGSSSKDAPLEDTAPEDTLGNGAKPAGEYDVLTSDGTTAAAGGAPSGAHACLLLGPAASIL